VKPDKTVITGLDMLAEDGNDYEEVLEDAKNVIERKVKEFGASNFNVIIALGKEKCDKAIFKGNVQDYYYYVLVVLSDKILSLIDEKRRGD